MIRREAPRHDPRTGQKLVPVLSVASFRPEFKFLGGCCHPFGAEENTAQYLRGARAMPWSPEFPVCHRPLDKVRCVPFLPAPPAEMGRVSPTALFPASPVALIPRGRGGRCLQLRLLRPACACGLSPVRSQVLSQECSRGPKPNGFQMAESDFPVGLGVRAVSAGCAFGFHG